MDAHEELYMKVVGIKGSVKAVNHITAGIKKHGDTYELADSVNDPIVRAADAFLQTNLLKPKFATKNKSSPYEYILKTEKPFLVQESPNFRKYIGYQRLGWWSYKWTEGEFGNENSPPDRWNKFQEQTNIQIKDWNSQGDKIIIMGQKPGDSSLTDLYDAGKNFTDWIQETVNEIRKHTDREIIIRPHPRNLRAGLKGAHSIKGKNIKVSENLTEGGSQGGLGLDADLRQAHCVVTYNSLSAIESVCDGIPTFAMNDGSMIWPIAHKDLSNIENLKYDIDIKQWCYDIAYTQWTTEEQIKGESWAHLKPLIFKG